MGALEKLNEFTRRNFTEEEVYIFPVTLCGNEIDRDFEIFSKSSLQSLANLYKGVTGVFDHRPSVQNQTARIFDTEIITDSTKMTTYGEPYMYLKGYAYMVRTDSNADLIKEIDGGIKKEVSVSCSANQSNCSICGTDRKRGTCKHQRGQIYDGKLCYFILNDISDAYEWSFVAIPSQKDAGVTKSFIQENKKGKSMCTIEKLCSVFNLDKSKVKSFTDSGGNAIDFETVKLSDVIDNIKNEIEKRASNALVAELIESEPLFLSADIVKAKAGKELTAEETLEIIGNHGSLLAKAAEYDKLKASIIDEALKNGVRAEGESFNSEFYKKSFESSSIEDIQGLSAKWLDKGKDVLHGGIRKSEPYMQENTSTFKVEDYKI